jgi:hypothetical protein
MDFSRSRTAYDDMIDFHKSCPVVGSTIAGGTSLLLLSSVISFGGPALLVSLGVTSLSIIYKKLNRMLYSGALSVDKYDYFYSNLQQVITIESVTDLGSLGMSAQKNILSVAADLGLITEDDLFTSRQSAVLVQLYIKKVERWMTGYTLPAEESA